jgi:hypothetical protein
MVAAWQKHLDPQDLKQIKQFLEPQQKKNILQPGPNVGDICEPQDDEW